MQTNQLKLDSNATSLRRRSAWAGLLLALCASMAQATGLVSIAPESAFLANTTGSQEVGPYGTEKAAIQAAVQSLHPGYTGTITITTANWTTETSAVTGNPTAFFPMRAQ